jgi:membrane-bound lytic murein transglycosylase D
VKTLPIILFLLCFTCAGRAQEQFQIPDELLQSVEQWARENLDESVLQMLEQVDQDRVREFFAELQRRFEGASVYDLGSLKDTASRLLPLLQRFEETRPYAVWLQTHFDYFDTAEELRREMKPPSTKPGAPAPLVNPAPQLQRSVWNKRLTKRPLPALAAAQVPRLKEIFTAEKMPPELVWMAEVESSFDPSARSPAGAAGLFQLMPATARTLSLSTWPRDERLQPEKNARAAAKYLRYLYGRFGDWRLALAAYNVGETRVHNLLKGQKTRTFDAIAGRLPAETQMYVPKVEATLRLREGRTLADLKVPTG